MEISFLTTYNVPDDYFVICLVKDIQEYLLEQNFKNIFVFFDTKRQILSLMGYDVACRKRVIKEFAVNEWSKWCNELLEMKFGEIINDMFLSLDKSLNYEKKN